MASSGKDDVKVDGKKNDAKGVKVKYDAKEHLLYLLNGQVASAQSHMETVLSGGATTFPYAYSCNFILTQNWTAHGTGGKFTITCFQFQNPANPIATFEGTMGPNVILEPGTYPGAMYTTDDLATVRGSGVSYNCTCTASPQSIIVKFTNSLSGESFANSSFSNTNVKGSGTGQGSGTFVSPS